MFQLQKAPVDSEEKMKAQRDLDDEISHREHVDNVILLIANLLFGGENSSTMMLHYRPPGQPLVDDWDCFKTSVSRMIYIFELSMFLVLEFWFEIKIFFCSKFCIFDLKTLKMNKYNHFNLIKLTFF